MELWTTWLDYKTTGQGRTVMACITTSGDASQAIATFQEKFGEYFAMGCTAEAGLPRNKVTKLLFSKAAMDTVESERDAKGEVCLFGSLHLSEVSGLQAGLMLGAGEIA